ncbi:sodium-independent anion transporter [Sediminihabitans luteus]|nr:sodium-independent anion transporter [Sediminihabitans luteus]
MFSIPEGMAYAQLAGVDPVYGLYSGIVATLVAALTTGSVLMISTLTSAIALSTGSVLSAAAITDAQMPGALFTVTLLTGAVMFLLGVLRLGSLVNFVSSSVMTGFVAGASVLIILGELGDFSGYEPEGGNKLTQTWDWLTHVGSWDLPTTLVAVASLALVIVGKRFSLTAKLAPVLVLVVMTVVVALADLGSVATVGDIASIPRGLPGPEAPAFDLVPTLALGAVSVALVALVQGAGISTAYPNPDGSPAPPSRDFLGQGLGNLAGSFFQSMPTGGSLSRTGISVSGGARSRWGGVLAAVWLAALLVLLGSLAERVPLAVIAGLLFVIAGELVLGRVAYVRMAFETSYVSFAAGALTFVSALFVPLQWTIFLGAGLSIAVFVASSSRAGRVDGLVRGDDGYWQEGPVPDVVRPGEVVVLGLRGWSFFAEFPRLAGLLPDPRGARGAVVVLRLHAVPDMNMTGLRALDAYRHALAQEHATLVLAGVQPRLAAKLERTGVGRGVGTANVFAARPGITQSLDAAVQHARRLASPPAG